MMGQIRQSPMSRPRVVIIGAGFAGLSAAKALANAPVDVVVIDRHNYHLFQPLLYQVATAGLSPSDIAQPIRAILSKRSDLTVLMDSVVDFDLARKQVRVTGEVLDYDYLVLALGGCTSYFGHPEWESVAPGLKSLEDA